MYCTRKITDSVYWVGGSDRRLALFENLFPIPRGVAYNAYLILDEKTALMDTVDASIGAQFLQNVAHVLGGRPLDYLIIDHMEPDHCANIEALVLRFPQMKLVGNAKTFTFLSQFYGLDLADRAVVVKEGDSLPLGSHTLTFHFAPMVHWPEVMVTYEASEKLLFSADAFGSFGALDGNIFNDEVDFPSQWLDDARRYYTNIVGKYGPQVQAALKKLSALDIRTICPLHGPIWRTDLPWLLEKYDRWSRYEPEETSVAILYGSMYGDTENAANVLACALADAGVKGITVRDVSVTHVSQLIADAFRCSHLVLAVPTYNNGIYPAMLDFLHDMKALGLRDRTVGLIENGTWGPTAAKQLRAQLDEMKGMTVLEPVVTIKSALNEGALEQLHQLKDAILASMHG
ncbi:FprA family A-type flavoprotein [Pseudoflavonifractor sp. MSJ-37]|uniref:FprA family A-type flavoprotein n=1 Tax=Pseudoflavonifractor sp. MSJ-37 TaxID=2841531 RepID=UPI001C1062F6|nr:FprA family A-type flavoprotein [Pseudoflavonifractor sp. MSJ-37]MBU5434288.1 FprA family A-type flavoprotein [Pseudoflavonifractor sp. MSJ-37]